MFCKDQLRLIFSKCLRGKGQHEYQDLDPKLWKRAFWPGTFPGQNCQELMEQVTGLEMLRGCHSYTSKIHFRTESWFRAHSWPRAGEVRAPRDRLTTQAGWESDENLGYFKARVIKKGQCHSKTNPSTSIAHLYARHVFPKLNETEMSAHQHSTMEQGHVLHCKYLVISKLPFSPNQRPYWNLCVSWALTEGVRTE